MLCPCCSLLPFEQCCQPIINGKKSAPSPEALMRSRYSAYCTKAIDYIYDTYAKVPKARQSKADIQSWAENVTFVGLEIVEALENDAREQFVEFCADYLENGQLHKLHEKSLFIQEQGAWRYLNGTIIPEKSVTPGRNDICPCNSGKKFKKCHGR